MSILVGVISLHFLYTKLKIYYTNKMKVQLFIPKTYLGLEQNELTDNELIQSYIFLDFLIYQIFTANDHRITKNSFIAMRREFIIDISCKDYQKMLKFLERNEFIKINNHYSSGFSRINGIIKQTGISFPKSYALVNTDISIIEVNLTPKNVKKYNLTYYCKNKLHLTDDTHGLNQINFIKSLKLNTEEFDYVMTELYKAKGKEIYNNTEYYSEISETFDDFATSMIYTKRRINNWDITSSFGLYDNFSGRYHHCLTNINSELRKCFKHDTEKLVEVDLKSSQIYFLSQLQNFNEMNRFEDVDISKIEIEDAFKDMVINNDIYEDYRIFSNKKSRDIAKEMFISYLYGKNNNKTVATYLQTKFPKTFNTILYLKSLMVDGYTKETTKFGVTTNKSTYLNYVLQTIERIIVLGAVGDNETQAYTVHDSIVTVESNYENILDRLNKIIELKGLDKPKVKTTKFD